MRTHTVPCFIIHYSLYSGNCIARKIKLIWNYPKLYITKYGLINIGYQRSKSRTAKQVFKMNTYFENRQIAPCFHIQQLKVEE